MPRGGYRPSNPGGRPKGAKDSKPRKGTKVQLEAEKIRQMLALGVQAKKKFYHEFLVRVANQDKKQVPLSIAEKNLMNKLAVELAAELHDGKSDSGVSEELDPLTYMLRVMNDPKEDPAVRRQMAAASAPYVHPRAGESGKKEEKTERAKTAGAGQYASMRSRLKVVK